jgi:hypothetical protein
MSFLSGLKKVGSWITGSSFSANLAKTAIIGYTIYRLNRNLNKQNNPNATIDEGVRLQINPSAENKIPVVYGAAFLSGIITDAEMTGNNKTMFFCLTISEKTGQVFSTSTASTTTFRNVYWNDQLITFKPDGVTVDFTQDRSGVIDRSLEGRVRVYCYDGGSNQPRAVQGFSSTGLVNADTLFPSWGSSTHQMNNLVFAVVRVDYDRDRGVTSLGNVKFHVENSMTKPGDCLFDYFTNSIYGAGVPSTEVDTATLTALNSYSDQSVVYTDQVLGANQVLAARYRINGVVDTEKAVLENIEDLASSAGSWVSYDVQKGQWGIVINRAENAIVNFDDSTIIGSISINGTGIDDLYNRVKADFPNRDIRDAADFVTIALPENERNANEYENTLNIVYDLINEPVQAEILSFIELKQSRVDLVIRFTTDYSYTILTAGDVVNVSNSRVGWTNKAFRVIAVNEKQDETGQLLVDITALEYNADVYSVLDLFRFTRSDQNGIITIGSIGVPGTPVVTKIEQASRPRIIVNSTSPTGIVERMEIWRTTDVNLAESQRNYTLIGTVNPVGGGTFGIGQLVTFEYDSQGAGNFLIKTRGVNSITTGPFSEPSGIIEFVPQQTTDVIGPSTSLSGIIGALGALELLNLLDKLFKNDSGEGGLFDKIFSIFKDETGVDILGDAKEGDLVVAADLAIKSDGEEVTTTVSSLDFTGAIEATGTDEVEVKLIDGKNNKDVLAWNAAAGEWQIISGCITCDFPAPPPPPPAPATPCTLTVNSTLPANNHTLGTLCVNNSDVPSVGSYFIKWNINPGTNVGGGARPPIPFNAPLQKGVGNVYLYGTDGVLEQTLTESQILIANDVVELPFAPRMPGKDYYILIDDGLVTSCSCENAAITSPTVWTFRTSLTPQPAYARPAVGDITEPTAPTVTYANQLRATSSSLLGANVCVPSGNFRLTFSENITAGSGIVEIKERLTGSTVASVAIGGGSVSENFVEWTPISGLQPNTSYDIIVPQGLVLSDRPATTTNVCDAVVTTPAGPTIASEPAQFGFSTVQPLQLVRFDTCRETSGATAISSNIQIVFNKTISINPSAPSIVSIFSSNGGLHQAIDLKGTFATLKYGSIYGVATSTITLNPTKPFSAGTEYYVNIGAGAIIDSQCGQTYPGITDTATIRFATEGVEIEAPTGPDFGSVFIRFQFGRQVVTGNGKLNIIDADTGELYTQVASNDPAIRFSNERFV